MAIEPRPDADCDTGRTLRGILGRMDLPRDAVPNYFGNDSTDEDAFDQVATAGIGVIGVVVRLRSVADLIEQPREPTSAWSPTYDGYPPHAEKMRETLAAMAGSIDLLQRCFSGPQMRSGRLILNPRWPKSLGELSFRIFYRDYRLQLQISGSGVSVTSEDRRVDPITVECRGVVHRLGPGGVVYVR